MNRKIILLAHNIRSLLNVGSFFRSSDCFGVEKIIFSGYTGIPPRREISKTAIGAEEWIPWEKVEDPIKKIKDLKKEGYKIVSLEINNESTNINNYKVSDKVCLILGNEILGVPKEMLEESDDIIYIPMLGKKSSLNVSVAAGIALNCLSK
ncbi:MAG: hypothetical protein KAS32_16405 [Candidatus Peribacteraceae bacterium]|nr:hypothetical protein [Candidatus Peribacteraceae bacterium]